MQLTLHGRYCAEDHAGVKRASSKRYIPNVQVGMIDRKGVGDDEAIWWRMYTLVLYVNSVSNMLFVLHSATNWILFYNWGSDLRTRARK